MMKINQRSNYSPERDLREREQYREKRREYSPESKNLNLIEINRQHLLDPSNIRENSLIIDNNLLNNPEHFSINSSNHDQQWREMNSIDEIVYNDRYIDTNDHEHHDDEQNQFISNDNDHIDRQSLDRVSLNYQRDDDTTFVNYDDRDDDRYRDDGIFV